MPQLEKTPLFPHQIVPQPFDWSIAGIDPCLNVPFQVSPAPLQSKAIPIHFGAGAIEDNPLIVADQLDKRLAGSIMEDAKYREQRCHSHPEPGFDLVFLRRRLVHVELWSLFQFTAKLFVGGLEGGRDKVLNLDRPDWTARDVGRAPKNIAARRLLCRTCPINSPTNAPRWASALSPLGTPTGKSAAVVMPQQGQ
jgi:hypothetical protein